MNEEQAYYTCTICQQEVNTPGKLNYVTPCGTPVPVCARCHSDYEKKTANPASVGVILRRKICTLRKGKCGKPVINCRWQAQPVSTQ